MATGKGSRLFSPLKNQVYDLAPRFTEPRRARARARARHGTEMRLLFRRGYTRQRVSLVHQLCERGDTKALGANFNIVFAAPPADDSLSASLYTRRRMLRYRLWPRIRATPDSRFISPNLSARRRRVNAAVSAAIVFFPPAVFRRLRKSVFRSRGNGRSERKREKFTRQTGRRSPLDISEERNNDCQEMERRNFNIEKTKQKQTRRKLC